MICTLRTFLAIAMGIALSATALAQAPAPAEPAQQPATPQAPADAPPKPPAPPPVVGDHNATLADQLPSGQVLWLRVDPPNPEPAQPAQPAQPADNAAAAAEQAPAKPDPDAGKFLARFIPDLSGEPRGAVIILHDSDQHPSWPFTVAALLDDLPLHGWSSLSIELPAPAQDAKPLPPITPATPAPANKPADGTPNTAAEPAADTTAPTPPASPVAPLPEPLAQARIAAALRYLTQDKHLPQDKKVPVAIIGFGSGAYRAAEFAAQIAAGNPDQTIKPIAALVLIAPRNSLPGIASDLPQILPTTTLPTLDMVLSSDALARADAEARRRAVLHQRTRIYQRIEFPPINQTSSPDHSSMVKRVRGFLQQQIGKGGTDPADTPRTYSVGGSGAGQAATTGIPAR